MTPKIGSNHPMVSVVIPTFNRAAFLKEAVESVLLQTYPNVEIIIVDDGSSEDQQQFLVGLKGSYRFLTQPNRGVSSARNLGIAGAEGDYIALLDSDDLWDRKKLQKQVERMESLSHVLIGHTDEIWIRNGVRVNQKKRHKKVGGWIFSNCLPLCAISPSSVIIRRELFKDVGLFDESLPACEDYDFWLRITRNYYVDFLDEKLTIKRGGHGDQLSKRYWGMDRFRVRAISKLLKAGNLTPEQERNALKVYKEKCRILSDGSRKRNFFERSGRFSDMAQRFG